MKMNGATIQWPALTCSLVIWCNLLHSYWTWPSHAQSKSCSFSHFHRLGILTTVIETFNRGYTSIFLWFSHDVHIFPWLFHGFSRCSIAKCHTCHGVFGGFKSRFFYGPGLQVEPWTSEEHLETESAFAKRTCWQNPAKTSNRVSQRVSDMAMSENFRRYVKRSGNHPRRVGVL